MQSIAVFFKVPQAMPLRVKKILKDDLRQRLERCQKQMPFTPSPRVLEPRSMKDRQQAWVLAGLKHIGAPCVPGCNSVIYNQT